MRKFSSLCLIFAAAGVAFAGPPDIQKRTNEISASLIEVIAKPEKFDGENLVVGGYLCLGSEIESSLFLDKSSKISGMTANSIAVDLSESESVVRLRAGQLDGQYVFLAGKFTEGSTAFSGGTLRDIYRIIPAANSNRDTNGCCAPN